jgi:hypothetical protein
MRPRVRIPRHSVSKSLQCPQNLLEWLPPLVEEPALDPRLGATLELSVCNPDPLAQARGFFANRWRRQPL